MEMSNWGFRLLTALAASVQMSVALVYFGALAAVILSSLGVLPSAL